VHYSIDIFGGWLMAYLCQRLVQHFFPIWMPQIATL
jgi:membrane-associated phospholipid phosphatase